MGTYLPGLNFPIYSGWTQYTPVIPKFYWDVYSAEQRMKQLCLNFDKVEHYLDFMAEQLNEWGVEFSDELSEQLADMWQQVNDGYRDAIDEWFRNDAANVMKNIYSSVYFGLNQQGYFVAYVPESWSDVMFDTGADYALDTYGRLILRMDVDSPYETVVQWPEVVRPYDEEYLRAEIRNIMNTLYATE